LNLLQDSGIGGLRSTGHGGFTVRGIEQPDVQRPQRGYGVCLSRYAPRDAGEIAQALQAPASAYAFVTVGGWCQDDAGKAWRRKGVRLVAEGACLGAAARGHLVDVMPQGVMARAVYRYGLAFCVPVNDAALATAALAVAAGEK
jgi:CRISPR-associated protein Csm4